MTECPCCGSEGTWIGWMPSPEGEVQIYNCYPCDQKFADESETCDLSSSEDDRKRVMATVAKGLT